MVVQFKIKYIILMVAISIAYQSSSQTIIAFDPSKTYQTIENFGASDAWSCQFVGNWPNEKKKAIADLLFSIDTLKDGSPKGIGLSLWRYNIGSGSANQGTNSGIKDEWRRAAFFFDDRNEAANRINAQNWFLLAAKKRGVKQFLGFFNSPPVNLTINEKAFASKGKTNINENRYRDFADYAVDAIKNIEKSTGIAFGFISPVNEPQWDWSDDKQEGCPYTNNEISKLVRSFNEEFIRNNIKSKIILPESGHLKYLLSADDKQDKDDQVNEFFNPISPNYVGNLETINRTVAAHSYFSTSPFSNAIALRKQIAGSISNLKGLQLWQSEYCILGDNDGEINGSKRDLGMDPALYVAKVIYEDLVWANASAWQWWLAISPYNYKDGLIYVDKNNADGNYYDSKILWAFGNYSAFVRPGMKRVEASTPSTDLLVSAFKDNKNKSVVIIVNPTNSSQSISFRKQNKPIASEKRLISYTTDATKSLKKNIITANKFIVPAKSVVSVIIN